MSNNYFQFKRFTVQQEFCAMKVGTDGVLLGAWADAEKANNILDIGTGSGLIALMLAQRSNAHITAIDIDEGAVKQATINIQQSPWKEKIDVIHCSLQKYASATSNTFDLIISNPPFFINSLKSGCQQRDYARHSDTLPLSELIKYSKKLLSDKGILTLIYPTKQFHLLEDLAWEEALYPFRITTIYNTAISPSKRTLVAFSHQRNHINRENLILKDERNQFTTKHLSLCSDFYL